MADPIEKSEATKLAVIWTSCDPDVAKSVCFMYTHNAFRNLWFDRVRLIVWGPSAGLLAGNDELKEQVKEMIDDGIEVYACIAGAKMFGAAEALAELGVSVTGMGKPLSDMLQQGWRVLTF